MIKWYMKKHTIEIGYDIEEFGLPFSFSHNGLTLWTFNFLCFYFAVLD